jgi:hypothetical protein
MQKSQQLQGSHSHVDKTQVHTATLKVPRTGHWSSAFQVPVLLILALAKSDPLSGLALRRVPLASPLSFHLGPNVTFSERPSPTIHPHHHSHNTIPSPTGFFMTFTALPLPATASYT